MSGLVTEAMVEAASRAAYGEHFERYQKMMRKALAAAVALLPADGQHRDQKTGRTAQASPEGVPCGGVSRQDQVASGLELAAQWHGQRYRETPDAFEMEFHEVSAKAIRSLGQWKPTHRHHKGGGFYQFVGAAQLQSSIPLSDTDSMVVYQAEDGTLWVRPDVEFYDGRFLLLADGAG